MSHQNNTETHPLTKVSFPRFVGYFLWLGTVGFGGPIALAGHMQQDLVDERGWISKEDYLEGLALAQLAPGPLAAQLAIYLGYIRAGVLGATAVGVAFVLPSFLMVLALSAAYVRFGGLPWMQGMFYGIGAAVIGIITRSAFKLTKLTLGKDKLLWGIFTILAVSTAWTSHEIIWLFLLGGVVSVLVKAYPMRVQTRSVISLLFTFGTFGVNGTLSEIFLYFAKAGMFVFGSGLAVVPFLYGGVVQGHHWLTDRPSIRRCGCRCNDHAGTGCNHRGIHWFHSGWSSRCDSRGARNISPCLSGRRAAGTFIQTLGEEPPVECFCAGRHRSRDRSHCGGRDCARPPFNL